MCTPSHAFAPLALWRAGGPAAWLGRTAIAVAVLLGLVVIVLLYGVVEFNRLVALRNRCDNGWSQIDVQLRRRYDLIPQLVETVRGYGSRLVPPARERLVPG